MTNNLARICMLCLASSLFFSACGGNLRYPGLSAEEVLALGFQAREQEEWEDAAEAFEFILFAPGFDGVAEARLLLAEVQYRAGRYIEARSEYQRVIDRWPADTVAVTAAFGVCRSLVGLSPITQRDQSSTRQARLSCRQVAADLAGTMMGLEAARLAEGMQLKLAEQDYDTGLHYQKRGLFDSALLYFERIVSEFSETEWAPWALYQMVDVFGRIGYLGDVETTRDLLIETYPDSEPAQLLLVDGEV